MKQKQANEKSRKYGLSFKIEKDFLDNEYLQKQWGRCLICQLKKCAEEKGMLNPEIIIMGTVTEANKKQ